MDENIVRSAPLFAALDDDGKQAVLDSMTQEDFHRGSVVFREGDQGDRLFIIASGKIKVGHASGDGRENLLAVLGPGETLGELSLFDPAPRNATATAVAETTLYSLSQQDLYRVLAQRPEVARHLLASLARRLRKTNDSLADLVFADVPGRVAKNLLDLAQRFGRQSDEGIMVSHGLTQEELAQLVGASRETVNSTSSVCAAAHAKHSLPHGTDSTKGAAPLAGRSLHLSPAPLGSSVFAFSLLPIRARDVFERRANVALSAFAVERDIVHARAIVFQRSELAPVNLVAHASHREDPALTHLPYALEPFAPVRERLLRRNERLVRSLDRVTVTGIETRNATVHAHHTNDVEALEVLVERAVLAHHTRRPTEECVSREEFSAFEEQADRIGGVAREMEDIGHDAPVDRNLARNRRRAGHQGGFRSP